MPGLPEPRRDILHRISDEIRPLAIVTAVVQRACVTPADEDRTAAHYAGNAVKNPAAEYGLCSSPSI